MFTYKPSYSFLCSPTSHPILSYVHLQAILFFLMGVNVDPSSIGVSNTLFLGTKFQRKFSMYGPVYVLYQIHVVFVFFIGNAQLKHKVKGVFNVFVYAAFII